MASALISLRAALAAAETARRLGLHIGYTSGVFDLFHAGHAAFLAECGKRCGFLVVGVDDDPLVRLKKGAGRPAETANQRRARVVADGHADFAFCKRGSTDEFLSELAPKVYFVATDKTLRPSRVEALRLLGATIVALPRTPGISTSQLLGDR